MKLCVAVVLFCAAVVQGGVVKDKPLVDDTPSKIFKPLVEDTPSVKDTPSLEDTPVKDKPSVKDTPSLEDTPVKDKPSVKDTPSLEDTPVKDTPSLDDTPVIDTPSLEDTPVKDTPSLEGTPVKDTPSLDDTASEKGEVGPVLPVHGYVPVSEEDFWSKPVSIILDSHDAADTARLYFSQGGISEAVHPNVKNFVKDSESKVGVAFLSKDFKKTGLPDYEVHVVELPESLKFSTLFELLSDGEDMPVLFITEKRNAEEYTGKSFSKSFHLKLV